MKDNREANIFFEIKNNYSYLRFRSCSVDDF